MMFKVKEKTQKYEGNRPGGEPLKQTKRLEDAELQWMISKIKLQSFLHQNIIVDYFYMKGSKIITKLTVPQMYLRGLHQVKGGTFMADTGKYLHVFTNDCIQNVYTLN
ncbi:hypothetical protein XENOCAPTIV_008296 [Xenoophorus captivus]|uniref:Uncharacterized protein n=1 Tax=Xenoophorus captivus TaxID=1517983 RepID=A0ABV0RJ93_9TELE